METDLELLNSARTLNKEALIKIFDLYSSTLYFYALRLCGDSITADQIVGDVFAKLLDQFSAGTGPKTNLRSYLYETAYHQIVDEARSARHRAPLEVAEWLPADGESAQAVEDQVLFKQIVHAIQSQLTRDQRHVIVLRFLEGFSLHETAIITGKRVSNVKVIQNRAIAALRKAIDSHRMKAAASPSQINNLPKAL